MTQPADSTAPATGAETTETTATTEPAAAPDYKAMYEAAQAEAEAQKAHNRKIEQRYKNRRDASKTETKPDSEKDDDPRVKAATAAANEARVEARLTRLAAGYSPEALDLVQNIPFREEIDELDFDTLAEFDELVTELFEKRLGKKKPAKPATSTSGGEFNGGAGHTAPITEEQLAKMTPQEVDAAWKAGKLKHLM